MDKIETPEDEEILKFLNDLADYCIPMDGGKMRMTAQVWPIVKARDALLRADERQKAAEDKREAHIMICQLCKRLNPQHTGDPDTCKCADTRFLRAALLAEPEEAKR